jgi:hypothetical protein
MAIEKGPGSLFSVKLSYKHRGAGGSFWIGVGLLKDRREPKDVSYWFGQWYGHGDDGEWQPYTREIAGLYPNALPTEAKGETVHVCKVAATHAPPFANNDGVLKYAWDADVYISKLGGFKIDKPESTYW